MAGSQDSALAIAVCQAGGLGSLPCAMLSVEKCRAEILAIRAATAAPYNINFFCHTPPAENAVRAAKWRQILEPYYLELGARGDEAPAVSRAPFSHAMADAIADLAPPIVSFHFGLPAPELLARTRAWGAMIFATATTVEEARWLEAHGADAIIAQGVEAGGHRGMFLTNEVTTQMGTLALLPQLVAAVRVPVIAAGGIADAAGVRAARALGAVAVQLGTAFLSCPEATTSRVHRAALADINSSTHTALTNLFSGRPARGIVNRVMRELGPLRDDVPAFPEAARFMAPLRTRAESAGSGDFSPLWAGQNIRRGSENAADIVRSL